MDNLFLFSFLSVGVTVLFSFITVLVWTAQRRKEREAYYRSETIKKIAESPAPGTALEYLRETERITARRIRGGLRLGGLVVMAAGLGVMVFLWGIGPDKPIYLAGFIPVCIGTALFGYAQFLAPKD